MHRNLLTATNSKSLRRLQGDALLRNDGLGWNWTPKEIEALITVMDAVRDTYEMAREQLAQTRQRSKTKTLLTWPIGYLP
jgi:hypothetical protein